MARVAPAFSKLIVGRVQYLRALIALALLLCTIAQAEIYKPKLRPVIPELVLSDGRTLKDAKILSDTAYTVSVASGGKILPVEKKLLPAELLAQWPIDEGRGAQEHAREAALDQAAAERKEALALAGADAKVAKDVTDAKLITAVHIERQKRNAAYAAKTEAEFQAREAAFYDQRAAMAASRYGLVLAGVVSSYGNLYVLISNVSDGLKTFDWAALRVTGRTFPGEHQLAGPIVLKGQTENLFIPARRYRVFRLKLTSQMESKSLRWVDRDEVYPVKQLYRQENSWDMRDEYRMERIETPPEDSEVEQVLVRATQPFAQTPLRKKS